MLASFIDVHLTLLVGSKWVAGRVENADITNEEIQNDLKVSAEHCLFTGRASFHENGAPFATVIDI